MKQTQNHPLGWMVLVKGDVVLNPDDSVPARLIFYSKDKAARFASAFKKGAAQVVVLHGEPI